MRITNADLTMFSSALLLIGTLGGYSLAGLNDSRRDARTLEREEKANRRGRAEMATRTHHERQLEILLELQDALRELMRSTIRVILADKKTLKEQGKTFLLPDDVNLHVYDARNNYLRLVQRVTNDDLRSRLESLGEFASSVVLAAPDMAPSDPGAEIARLDRLYLDMATRHEDVVQYLGSLLRSELTYEWIAPDKPKGEQ